MNKNTNFIEQPLLNHILYLLDKLTTTLFKQILKGAGRNPKRGRGKEGIKTPSLLNMTMLSSAW